MSDEIRKAFDEILSCVYAIENHESAELEYGTVITLGKIKKLCGIGKTRAESRQQEIDKLKAERDELREALNNVLDIIIPRNRFPEGAVVSQTEALLARMEEK